jgi:hypothetical protein
MTFVERTLCFGGHVLAAGTAACGGLSAGALGDPDGTH